MNLISPEVGYISIAENVCVYLYSARGGGLPC